MLRNLRDNLKRPISVWRRNALAWRISAGPSLLGNFVEPLFYLFALGYGLGFFVGEIEGMSYFVFLSSGILSSSAMNTATFEGLYLSYTRMDVRGIWGSMLSAPIGVRDIVLGEIFWMGTKSLISASSILLVISFLGLVDVWMVLKVLPVVLLAGLCFGSMALVITSFARNYEFFMYYVSLVITPMILLSGVFFPQESLPDAIRFGVALLPLQHIVEMIRPIMTHQPVQNLAIHLSIPLGFCIVCSVWAVFRFKHRLLN